MKVCLIRPPKLMVKGNVAPHAPTAPIGLALIAGALEAVGHTVYVVDGMAENPGQIGEVDIEINSDKVPLGRELVRMGLTPDEVLARIPADTQIIGISCMFSNNWLADRALLNFLGEKMPHVKFIAGGESITGLAETCLNQVPVLSICVLGEGEETVVDLVNTIEEGKVLSEVKGIMFKQGDGTLVKTDRRTRLKNLEEIAMPLWNLFPVEKYERHGVNGEPEPRKTLPIIATRGCPYSCTFCTSPDMWGTRYYMRKPENVADEMQVLIDKFGITNFEFYDLTAIIKKEWIIDFAKILLQRNMNVTWRIPAGTRSEAIDEEVAKYLYMSGCRSITYAPESGSPRMLKLIKKKVVISNMLQSMRYSHQQNMHVLINMIYGLPDEKHTDIWKTIWFMVQCSWVGVNDVALAIFRPYPGSALFTRLLQEGKVQLENDDFFVDNIFITDTVFDNSFYNENVSKFWYRFYHMLTLFVFYGSGYIFRPSKLVKAIRNIFFHDSGAGFEIRMLRSGAKHLRSSLKSKVGLGANDVAASQS